MGFSFATPFRPKNYSSKLVPELFLSLASPEVNELLTIRELVIVDF